MTEDNKKTVAKVAGGTAVAAFAIVAHAVVIPALVLGGVGYAGVNGYKALKNKPQQ